MGLRGQIASDQADRAEAETLARFFHETYERLAPTFGYETREASAVTWENVPAHNKGLMIETASEVIRAGWRRHRQPVEER
jgi:hypothetical protein